MRRGEIWWAALPEPAGSEPGHARPVLIVQADSFTRSRIGTVVAVALTGNLRLAAAPGNVLLPKGKTGLPRDCVANVSQIVTLDKSFLTEPAGEVSAAMLVRIDAGLRLVLSL